MNVSYIWFDLGLTLLRNNHCSLYQEALEAAGIHCELAAVEKAYHLANKYFMRERPGLLGKPERGRTDYSETLFDFLGLSFENPEADGYAGDRTTCLQIFEKELEEIQCRLFWEKFPFTDSVLEELHEKGIGTGLISNWDIHCRDILRATGLIDQLDTVVISSEVGYEKPAREIFEIALKKSGRKAEECLYVGDNYYDDVIGSGKVGMKALLINPSNRVGIEELTYTDVIESIQEIKKFL